MGGRFYQQFKCNKSENEEECLKYCTFTVSTDFIEVHSKSSDFFSVSEQFYILVEVESHPFINIQILNFFIYIIEGTLNQNV